MCSSSWIWICKVKYMQISHNCCFLKPLWKCSNDSLSILAHNEASNVPLFSSSSTRLGNDFSGVNKVCVSTSSLQVERCQCFFLRPVLIYTCVCCVYVHFTTPRTQGTPQYLSQKPPPVTQTVWLWQNIIKRNKNVTYFYAIAAKTRRPRVQIHMLAFFPFLCWLATQTL